MLRKWSFVTRTHISVKSRSLGRGERGVRNGFFGIWKSLFGFYYTLVMVRSCVVE